MKMSYSVISLAALLPAAALAQQPVLGASGHGAYVTNDAGSGSDFDGSFHFEGSGLLQLSPNLALEAGIGASTSAEDSGEDNQGSYTIEVASNDVFAGLRLDLPLAGKLGGYGRGGLLYYHSEIDFQEDFFGIKPGGSLEEVEEGTGYYLEGGLSLGLGRDLKLESGLTWRVRQDYFEDSIRPFDMKQFGLTVGLVFMPGR